MVSSVDYYEYINQGKYLMTKLFVIWLICFAYKLQEPSLKTRIKLSQLTRKDTQEFQLKNNVTV